jgi:protein phosphatase
VKLLTIGEFARQAGLSQKALRLYDELGLLAPAKVDEWSGYRYYAPAQLERARLVAWLRRLGMPLARIGPVVDGSPAEAAAQVTAFLQVTEADFAERQRLAQFLITYLSEGAAVSNQAQPLRAQSSSAQPLRVQSGAAQPAGTQPEPALAVRYAAASDTGLVRERNQDAGYAGPRLLAVADGFGPSGERASAAAIEALRPLETGSPGVADLLNALSDAVTAAKASVAAVTTGEPDLECSGSTLTAALLSGSKLALVHIGDSRAYLFRDGGLFQVTTDHSVTQAMIDSGRLTPEEAVSHPQRSLLLRALGVSAESLLAAGRMPPSDGESAGTPDVSMLDARPGDRYLLCSDGLTAVVPAAVIRQTLAAADQSPADVVRRLIALANEAGGPDNIACALADIVETREPRAAD